MPYQLTSEPDMLRIELFGILTAYDLQSIAAELEQIEGRMPVTPNRLTDATHLLNGDLNFADVFALAERRKVQNLANQIKSALVAPKPVNLGFARMFQILNDHPQIEIQIFPTCEAAEAWLADA